MKIILSSILVCLIFGATAQYGYKDEGIASRFHPGVMWFNTGWRPAKEGKDRKYDRLMIDANYSMLFNKKMLESNVSGSFGWAVHTMWDIPLTTGNTVSIGTGLSYKHQRVGYVGILNQNDSTHTSIIYQNPNVPDAHKQVLGVHTIAVPVELRFRMAKWRHLKLHVGGHIGYRLQGYQKVWTSGNGSAFKDKKLTDFNPISYGVHARVGIRNWSVFADYGLSPYFKSKSSSQFTFFTAGLTLSLF